MSYWQRFHLQFRNRFIGLLLLNNIIVSLVWWFASQVLSLQGLTLVLATAVVVALCGLGLAWASARYFTQPTQLLWQAILHLAPEANNVPAPDVQSAVFGRDLVTNLTNQIYQLATAADTIPATLQKERQDLHRNPIAMHLPLPLFVLDKNSVIVFANEAALHYLGITENDIVGKDIHAVLEMAFRTEQTLDTWLKDVRTNAVTASHSWEHVKLRLSNTNKELHFDLSAFYNQANPLGHETLLTLFDHTATYSQDDQALGFVAMAVHELRTPLTLLNSYIEVFQEELNGKLDPELTRFMYQMKSAADELRSFVNNILNVARIENNQLELELREEQWPQLVQRAVDDMRLRAQVRGITLELSVEEGLPTVAVDNMTIGEVLTNLIDNAIKYSQDSKRIVIHAFRDQEGFVRTTVQDFGIGLPVAATEELFEKFYRNHRHRAQVGGTGLGLYLSKAIVKAHGGIVFVKSPGEGQGSTFGFTLQPYATVATELKTNKTSPITRHAHGWIKNHSLYRG